ncbi:Glycosyltransferase, catalytic subunit of cellulose synthase and poly-beta-1,6-N-acetylglucosamine synthase [Devosia sp. YR412]|uniref:glycosyltransferase family 2 protein n=1 Tax=Devosia sp. YR412 TaxID=1881030 RepID=UPI0008ACC6F6|nr:glycosyltransferase family 2 protein [Devosia sp. YR412]SEQ54700.1 Glycosyltransferase, catalytic subunit of cellulose synthase and poly-beta-1,6-N-acetylglucosamine synthase [Devosia sp. YR412]
MSHALDLVKAILAGAPEERALNVLETALLREVDVLLYCATALGMHPTVVMQRAAAWAGYSFYDRVPDSLQGEMEPTRLEGLASVRLLRLRLPDCEMAFTAPDFFDLIRLRKRLLSKPHLRHLVCIVPEAALRDYLVTAASPALIDAARQNLARRWPFATAQLELTRPARQSFVAAIILLVALVLTAPHFAQLLLLPVTMVLLLAPAAIRLAAAFEPLPAPTRLVRPVDEELPVYSVLIPLRNEAAMVSQLFAAMRALDYPEDRLDIKFVVEAASLDTIAAVRRHLGEPRFSLVSVPDAAPRTKPKALDFALPLCLGEHVVVFDAEDIPDPDQLWKAAVRFRDAPELVCLQAQLVIDNGRASWLTAQFAGEYAGLFSVLLPALARWRLPMPLGGTSNHFRLEALRQLGGWDAFNVTEDADLGTRLARRRLRVDVLESHTLEHAPTKLAPWLGQRTRWMKGWMQTFIVHNRDPGTLLKEMGWPGFLAFQTLVLGMIVAPVLHCAFLATLTWRIAAGAGLVDGSLWTVFYLAMLALGYGSALAMTVRGLTRLGHLHLLSRQVFLPLYWLLIGLATLRALRELVYKPFYWFKTPHQPAVPALAARRIAGRRLGWLRGS